MFTWDLYFGITNHNKKLNVTSSIKCNYLSGHESLWNHSEKWWRRRRRRRDEWMREWKEKVKIMGEFWGAKGLPQYVAATIVDSLGDETHQANAPSTINQVDFPFNLQFLYNLSSIIAPINLTIFKCFMGFSIISFLNSSRPINWWHMKTEASELCFLCYRGSAFMFPDISFLLNNREGTKLIFTKTQRNTI